MLLTARFVVFVYQYVSGSTLNPLSADVIPFCLFLDDPFVCYMFNAVLSFISMLSVFNLNPCSFRHMLSPCFVAQ